MVAKRKVEQCVTGVCSIGNVMDIAETLNACRSVRQYYEEDNDRWVDGYWGVSKSGIKYDDPDSWRRALSNRVKPKQVCLDGAFIFLGKKSNEDKLRQAFVDANDLEVDDGDDLAEAIYNFNDGGSVDEVIGGLRTTETYLKIQLIQAAKLA